MIRRKVTLLLPLFRPAHLVVVIFCQVFFLAVTHAQAPPGQITFKDHWAAYQDEEVVNVEESLTRLIGKTRFPEDLEVILAEARKKCTGDSCTHRLTHLSAGRLVQLGEVEMAGSMYYVLFDMASTSGLTVFQGKALLGLGELAKERGEHSLAQSLTDSALMIYRNTNDSANIIYTLVEQAQQLRDDGKPDSALGVLDRALHFRANEMSHEMTTAVSSAYSTQGRLHRSAGRYEEAYESYRQALDLAMLVDHETQIAVVTNNLGNIAHTQGLYDQALQYYYQSLEIKERLGNRRSAALAHHNIGAVKYDLEDYPSAMESFGLSNAIAEELSYEFLQAYNALRIGNCHRAQTAHSEALQSHLKAKKLATPLQQKKLVLEINQAIGQDLISLERHQEAYVILQDALASSIELSLKPEQAAILINLAELYADLYDQSDGDKSAKTENVPVSLAEIEAQLQQAYAMSKEQGNVENQLLALKTMRSFYKRYDNPRAQSQALEDYAILRDSMYRSERTQAITEWETKYKTAEQDKEILSLELQSQKESSQKRLWRWLTIATLIFFGLLVYLGNQLQRQRINKQRASEREQFRSQLSRDLHDEVGSTLTGLAMQSELLNDFSSEKDKAATENLAKMSRQAMQSMRDTVWAIDSRKDNTSDLIDRMRDFTAESDNLSHQSISLRSKLKEHRKIHPKTRQNVYLVYKEAITNALKHSGGSEIKAIIKDEGAMLHLTIQDNGKPDPQQIKTSGLGLQSMRQRAEECGGSFEYKMDGGFKISASFLVNP